mgnify:CR=1 FL=1
MERVSLSRKSDWLCTLGLVLLAVIVYWGTTTHARLREDQQVVWSNSSISGSDLKGALLGNFYANSAETRSVVRPVSALFLRTAHAVFTFDRALYQSLLIALHGTATALLFWLARRRGIERIPAGVMAGLFAVHPLTTVATLTLAGTSHVLALTFALGALLLSPARANRKTGSLSAWIPSLLLLLAAILSHEAAFAFAPVLFVWALPVGEREASRTVRASGPPRSLLFGLVGVIAVAIAWRLIADAALSPTQQAARAVTITSGLSWFETARSGCAGVLVALGLFVAPWRLSYVHDGLLSLNGVLGATAVAGGLLALIGLAAWLGMDLRRGASERSRWIALAFFPLLAASGVLIPTGDLLNARMLYLALPGLLALVVIVLPALVATRTGRAPGTKRANGGRLALGLGVAVALLFAARTVVRARDFQDRETLIKAQIATDPYSAQAHFELGNLYLDRSAWEAARAEYERAVELRPELWEAWINLGAAYFNSNELGLSMRCYEQAWPHVKDSAEFTTVRGRLLFNRALILTKQNRNTEASVNLEEALEIFPNHLRAHAILAHIYANSNEYLEQSRFHLERAIDLQPDPDARRKLQTKLAEIEKRTVRKEAFEEHGDMNKALDEYTPEEPAETE